MRATATKTKAIPTPTTMAAAYPPAGVAVSNSSKKKKKKKGKGRAVDVDQQNAVGAVRGPMDGQVDGEDEGIDDDDDLPALESTGDHHNHHNHHNHHHHHHHPHPDHNHPHISHNHHHHGSRRTGLSPELESVHLNMTAKLNASAQAALRMTSTASAQAELLAAANELYRRMESETRDPTIDGGGRDGADSHSSEYWANHIRSFVQTTYPHGAAMSASERQKSEAMLALAQTMVDEAHSRAGFGSAPGGGPPSFDPALLSDPEFQRIVAMSRPSRNMNRFDEYAAEEYYSDNEELDDLEDVEHEQHPMQQYESTNDGTTNATSKKKKKKKKKGGAAHQHPQRPAQPTQPTQLTQTHLPTSTPNPNLQPPPPSMPAAPTITRAPPSAAQPPPSSRAAGKQPVYNANPPSSTTTTTNPVRTNSTSTARSTTTHPASTTNKSTTAPPTNGTATTPAAPTKEKNKLWSNSSEEERERIKDFWLGLSEAERRDLVKLEKEAVLKKMKEQQKHSCSCAVCGRKRNAIEEELEVLYDAYYEELEQYANHQQQFLVSGGKITPPPGPGPFPGSVALDSNGALVTGRHHAKHANNARVNGNGKLEYDEEEYDEEEEYEEDDDPEEDEGSDDDGSEPPFSKAPLHRRGRGGPGAVNGRGLPRRSGGRDDFLNFGSLTAAGPGNILTVADDLLKNDGQKFLEMMEQLAERRMQREEEAAREVEVDSEEDEEDDGSEDDEDDEDGEDEESEEEEEVLSEEQKMEEGRRMFSIFAARMFEQRVLNAYRERVASRRQEEFLRELEDEGKLQAERDAKKQKENQKKKDKKKMQKLAKEAEKAKKDADRAAEEAALKAKLEATEEEAKKKREEEKAKRESERKVKEEEKARQAEERRQRIAEQKAIEAEKRREREEREKKEKLARQEREAQQRAEKAERERKAREERLAKEAKEREEREKKEREEKDRKEKERIEREKAEQKKREENAAAIAAANATASANAARAKAAQQAAQVQAQAQMQSPNPPPISPRSGSFPPGTIGALQNNKQKTMPPMPNAKMPPIVAGPSIPRPPNIVPNLTRPPPPQARPMMPPPHLMGGPPPMSIPIPQQIPIMPMGFNPHVSPIAMSPSGRFPPGQPFGPIPPYGHGPPLSQVQQPPMMNGNVRNFAAPSPMDFPPPAPFDQPQQSQHVTPVLGSRSSLPGPSSSTTPSSTKPPTNGLLPHGLTGAPGPSNPPTTSPSSGLPPVHSRRQSASVASTPFGTIGTIGKPSPSTIAFGPSSVIGDDDKAIQPPSARMRASMDGQQVLGSSALVDESDEIVDLSELKRRGGMGGAVGPAAKNIWATNGTSKGGGWPAAPISSPMWSAPSFPVAPGASARPPPSQQQAVPERLRSPFLPSS